MVGELAGGRVGPGPELVPQDAEPGPAEQDVAAVRPLGRGGQPEQGRAAADDVVLAEPAEDDVGAAAALDVVVPVRRRLERRDDGE